MKKLLVLICPIFALAETPVSFIHMFGGNYELPKHCVNYVKNENEGYNITCDHPDRKYLLTINSESEPCISSEEIKSNERIKYKLRKEYLSHGLRFLELEVTLLDSNFTSYFRYVSSESHCLSIVGGGVEELNLVKIGAWN